jgi:hypothetical protein
MRVFMVKKPCNTCINYSEVIGEKIIPFLVELDLEASNLNPAPGENQHFSYNITGMGTDDDKYVNLKHIVFGICDEIPADQITNVYVTKDGVEQNVELGKNVELKTPESPDESTDCAGLKFEFDLDKVNGEMTVSFELKTPYPVGPNTVNLFGEGVTANTLSIYGPISGIFDHCETRGYQFAKVCVPVTVKPYAHAGCAKTFCYGRTIITPGTHTCCGKPNASCSFTITQRICVAVPVKFGARTYVSDTYVECEAVSDHDISQTYAEEADANDEGKHEYVENELVEESPKSEVVATEVPTEVESFLDEEVSESPTSETMSVPPTPESSPKNSAPRTNRTTRNTLYTNHRGK